MTMLCFDRLLLEGWGEGILHDVLFKLLATKQATHNKLWSELVEKLICDAEKFDATSYIEESLAKFFGQSWFKKHPSYDHLRKVTEKKGFDLGA